MSNDDFGAEPIPDEKVEVSGGIEAGMYDGVLGRSYRTVEEKYSSTDVELIILSKGDLNKTRKVFVESKIEGKDMKLIVPAQTIGCIFVVKFFDLRAGASDGLAYFRKLEKKQFANAFEIYNDETQEVKWSALAGKAGAVCSFELHRDSYKKDGKEVKPQYAQLRFDTMVLLGTRVDAASLKAFYDKYDAQRAQQAAEANGEPPPF